MGGFCAEVKDAEKYCIFVENVYSIIIDIYLVFY